VVVPTPAVLDEQNQPLHRFGVATGTWKRSGSSRIARFVGRRRVAGDDRGNAI